MLAAGVLIVVFAGCLGGAVWWVVRIVENNQSLHLEMLREMREKDAEEMRQTDERRERQMTAWSESLTTAIHDTTATISQEIYGSKEQVEQAPDTDQTRADQEWWNREVEEVGQDPTDYDLEDPIAWDSASRVANVRPGENPFSFMEPDQTGETYDG